MNLDLSLYEMSELILLSVIFLKGGNIKRFNLPVSVQQTNQYRDQHQKQANKLRSVMDFTMGILLVLFGIYFFIYRHLGLTLFKAEPSNLDYVMGAVFCLYGIWRIYRGYKKVSNR